MSSKFKVQSSKFWFCNFNFKRWSALPIALCALYFALCTFSACSVPNLEKPECTAARQTVREFYSYHFGNDMKPSKENLQSSEKFLTADLKQQLASQTETATDYFTATDNYPKAFRIGECSVADENKTIFQVVLFWKNDAGNEQREVKVETVKQNEKWLINKIF